jgi:rhodanese-related sulfurtransferase
VNPLLLLLGGLAALVVVRTLLAARPALPAEEARRAIEAGTAVLVDVREPAEWSRGVARPATLLAFSDLRGARRQWEPFLLKNRGKCFILYCASGARSGSAAALLRREGLDAVNLGGFSRWAGAGLPVRQPH